MRPTRPRLGVWGILVGNLFALREPNRQRLKASADPIGPGNDAALQELAAGAGIIVAAWGVDGSHMGRASEVRSLLGNHRLHYLVLTRSGEPGHPLYLRPDIRPKPWDLE